MTITIHPTAIVSPKASLGEGVKIGPYCIIEDDVEIGADTELLSFVHVMNHVRIGSECRLWPNVTLGGEPQDFAFRGERSFVRVGDRVVLRENATVHRASGEDAETVVGDGVYMMEGSHAGHNVSIGSDCVIANKVGLSGYSDVGEGTVMGGMAGTHQFVRIGCLCMIGGLSKVVKDVPPFTMADGAPARLFGLNTVGLRRRKIDAATRTLIKSFYVDIFSGKASLREALANAPQRSTDNPHVNEIVRFLEMSNRGIAPWGRKKRETVS